MLFSLNSINHIKYFLLDMNETFYMLYLFNNYRYYPFLPCWRNEMSIDYSCVLIDF